MTTEEIRRICKKYKIKKYKINPDESIDVDGDVNLFNMSLHEIPLRFNIVSGNFLCTFNKLTSLEGSPETVGGTFACSSNKLTNLIGSPTTVGGDFHCNQNELTSLEGISENIGGNFIADKDITKIYNRTQSIKELLS